MARRTSVKSINDVNLPAYLLKDMSMELLKTLDGQDEGTFYEFFQELQLGDVKTARGECERLQDMNRELALQNTDREPQFTQAKEELRCLVTEAEELKADYDQGYNELKRLQSRTELTTLRKQLQEATKTSEDSSEDFATEFVNGKSSLTVDEFVESLVKQRSEYWLRKVKLSKFDELSKNRRPVPVPRTRRPPEATPPMSSLQSVGSPGRISEGTTNSLPPYPMAPRGMPSQQPFPAAAYPGYQQGGYRPPVAQGYPPPVAPGYPRPGYPPVRPTTGYSQAPPPRPSSYNQYRQHRY
ncbi:vacuolar protein sorting-associated protein 37C-like isoform X2 [Halichondria panicea]|uniref:vacuolar protein sorting-associated protein 37C-like isoform X2 n=1 Tax=Halichondria panicea TaxID=6063 RepID=UPI00312B9197